MTSAIRLVRAAFFLVSALALFAACGGGDSSEPAASEPLVSAAGDDAEQEESEDEEELVNDSDELSQDDLVTEGEELTLEELEESQGDDGGEGERVDVASAEEDPVESMLNTVTLFRVCLEDQGFEFVGAPGFGGEPAEFEPDYLAALGGCATETGILDRMNEFGAAAAELSPEQITRNNFGFPFFVECLERKGWDVDEPAPDERGLLTVDITTGFRPPPGKSLLETQDINDCRQEQAVYTEENYVEDE